MKLYEYKITRHYVGEGQEEYKVNTHSQAASYLKPLGYHALDQEVFLVLTLDTKNKITGVTEVTRGLLDRSHAHPREVFKPAILASASKIIVAHNHPSGNTTPSQQDIDLTGTILEAGKLLGIPCVDHIIIAELKGDFKFRSMRHEFDLEFNR